MPRVETTKMRMLIIVIGQLISFILFRLVPKPSKALRQNPNETRLIPYVTLSTNKPTIRASVIGKAGVMRRGA